MTGIHWDIEDGIGTLTLAAEGRVNKVDPAFGEGFAAALDALLARAPAGILVASAHQDFCVGADLEGLYLERDASRLLEQVRRLGLLFRKLETAGVPVVAALTGSALGGGFELALACHHRVALDDARIQLGLPEVNLGLIPGAGGTQRLPRLLGLQPALELLLPGKTVRAPKALGLGLVDALAPNPTALREAAVAWIRANPGARQPWDRGMPIPGPAIDAPEGRQAIVGACALLHKKTAGAFAAPEELVAVVQEGLRLRFDRALEVEARAFARLATGDQAKDMIRTLWFFRNAAEKHQGLPGAASDEVRRVAVLGAGMMGAGLAYLCAAAGYDVVLKDVREDAVDRGLAQVRQQVAERLRHLDDLRRGEVLARVTGTTRLTDLDGADLVIEAVFEDLDLKHRVIRETEPRLAPGAIFASNTSALPITELATASAAPGRFIGLHFFSPVEQMPLLELVRGRETEQATVARCLVFCRRIGKLPIVVEDGYGFYTTRVFSAYILEGADLVARGHDPRLVEYAARVAGMVVPPLQVFDEVSLRLAARAFTQAERFRGPVELPGARLVRRLVELGRAGRADGAGFYVYQDGRRQGLWPGLAELAEGRATATLPALGRRMLLAQVVEAGRALDEGVLRRPQDAEVGAVFGIGFAPGAGGPLAWADRQGLPALVAELDALAVAEGPRWACPASFRALAESASGFFPEGAVPGSPPPGAPGPGSA